MREVASHLPEGGDRLTVKFLVSPKWLATFLLIFCSLTTLFCSQPLQEFTGRATGLAGTVVPGVTVTAYNADTNVDTPTKTTPAISVRRGPTLQPQSMTKIQVFNRFTVISLHKGRSKTRVLRAD